MKIDIQNHMLVPEHEVMTEDEIIKEFADVDYDYRNLPKIRSDDPVVKTLDGHVHPILLERDPLEARLL